MKEGIQVELPLSKSTPLILKDIRKIKDSIYLYLVTVQDWFCLMSHPLVQ